ncbi:hypothetical protein BDV41DRAFT_568676 [Aspergillus transmontanensis]|uniref:Uncharacterized protein n=1 Tax=Aspergillus transmontanensis TaxID=1034304 RepID=A0A5N6VI31_9EURO|nr:hypothetical protein BDV41DRAFT_568676 [Aspergillus transmontanensis]
MSSYTPRLYDPFLDSSITGSEEETPNCKKQVHMTSKGSGQKVRSDSPCSESDTSTIKPYHSGNSREQEETRKYDTPQEPKNLNSPMTQPPTRIPRGPVFQRQGQESVVTSQKGGRVISEQRSSIPIPIRSPERLNSRSKTSGEGFSGGIRVIEKPRGPRPHILAGQKKVSVSSSVEKAPNQPKESITSSSLPFSGWDHGEEMPKRPTNVYTGEYRTRPTLRIAPSAEKIIMGSDSPNSMYAVTQRLSPTLAQYPDTPKKSLNKGLRNTEDTPGTPGYRQQDSNTAGDNPVTPPPNPPQISFETIPKRDTSARQYSIPRKPVNSLSLPSLFTPSPESMQSAPPIPKLPESYKALMKEGMASGPVTPRKTASPGAKKDGQSPGESKSEVTIKPQNKRTASLQAASDFPIYDAPRSVQYRIFDDIVSRSPSHNMTPQSARIPDSRSNRMLDGFRNIFKHRSTVDKDEKGPNEISGLAIEDPNSSSAKLITSSECSKLDSGRTGPRASAKHPKLSEGWNKNLRLPIPSADRHKRPTISAPIPITPENMPSFARSTMAARTRAITSPRGQSAIAPQDPARRTHTVAATTGSPQRTSRPSKGIDAIMSPVPKQTNLSHSAGLTEPETITSQTKAPQIERSASSSLSTTLDEIHSCVEQLCNRARDESTPSKRERNLRMALSLQQQVSDYNSIDREVTEAEALVSKKRTDKCLVENILSFHNFLKHITTRGRLRY